MEYYIKLHRNKSGWFILYIGGSQVILPEKYGISFSGDPCADRESFARGGPILTAGFFQIMRER